MTQSIETSTASHDPELSNEPQSAYSDENFTSYIGTDTLQKTSDLKQLRHKALQEVNNLISIINTSSSTDALKSIISNLVSAAAIGRGHEKMNDSQEHNFLIKQKFAGNSHFKTQRCTTFFSMKRKSGRKRLKLTKPDRKDIEAFTKHLSQITPNICLICLCDEEKGLEENILWQQCSSCQGWVQRECDEVDPCSTNDYYQCQFCRKGS